MTETLVLLVAFLALPLVLLFATAGCVGDDAILSAKQEGHDKGVEEGTKKGAADAAAQAKDEAAYDKSILKEPLLVAYWRLNELQGQTTLVDSFDGHSGEYKHTAGIALAQKGVLALFQDPNDKSAEFLGTQGYAEIPYSPLLNPPELSIECWIKPEGTGTVPQVVLGSYEGNISSGFLLEIVRTVPAGGGASTVKVRARLGGGDALEADMGPGIQREGWRHVVLTYRRSMPSSAKLYVNADGGAPADEKDGVRYVVLASPQPMLLGAGQVGGGAAAFFEGRLDEVALYNGVLSNAQIQSHYQKSF
jgi:hypothetical protein